MKSINQLLVFGMFILSFSFTYGQEKTNCKVMDGEMEGVFIGKCKDGLATGKGVLRYSNSNGKYMFVGNFRKGKLHGEGQLFVFEGDNKKLLKEGVWKKGVYRGEKKDISKPYQIARKTNVDRYSVHKISDGNNRISFKFLQNGQRNSISDLKIDGDSGIRRNDSFNIANNGYDGIQLPFRCKVSYRTLNKMRTMNYDVEFEIIINESGVWEVILNN